jgi:TolB-like protein
LATVRTVAKAESADSSVEATGTVSQSPVVAVLPFLNNTGDPELEYLADGLTGNLINNLSRIAQLRVMSRSTVLRYKMKDIDLQRVGKELGVDTFLVGKINAWHGHTNVTVSVEVVNAHTGWQLWGVEIFCRSKTP